MVIRYRYSWCGLDFVSGGSTQLQAVRRMGWQKRWVGRRIVQKSKNYLTLGQVLNVVLLPD